MLGDQTRFGFGARWTEPLISHHEIRLRRPRPLKPTRTAWSRFGRKNSVAERLLYISAMVRVPSEVNAIGVLARCARTHQRVVVLQSNVLRLAGFALSMPCQSCPGAFCAGRCTPSLLPYREESCWLWEILRKYRDRIIGRRGLVLGSRYALAECSL